MNSGKKWQEEFIYRKVVQYISVGNDPVPVEFFPSRLKKIRAN